MSFHCHRQKYFGVQFSKTFEVVGAAESYPSPSQSPSLERCSTSTALNLHGQFPQPAGQQPSPPRRAAERGDRSGAGWSAAPSGGGEAGRSGQAAARVRRCGGRVAVPHPAGSSPLARSLPGCGSPPPRAGDSPSLRLSSGLGSAHAMCFLLSARVSCLLYSSHMLAGCRALLGSSPLRSVRLPREPEGLSQRWPFSLVFPRWVPLPRASEVKGGTN